MSNKEMITILKEKLEWLERERGNMIMRHNDLLLRIDAQILAAKVEINREEKK